MKYIYLMKDSVSVIEEKKGFNVEVFGRKFKSESDAEAAAYALEAYIAISEKVPTKVVNLSQVKM